MIYIFITYFVCNENKFIRKLMLTNPEYVYQR